MFKPRSDLQLRPDKDELQVFQKATKQVDDVMRGIPQQPPEENQWVTERIDQWIYELWTGSARVRLPSGGKHWRARRYYATYGPHSSAR